MRSGRIYLLDKHGEIITSVVYKTRPQRLDIISVWNKLYSKGLEGCAIQICPDVNSDMVKENGENMTRRNPQDIVRVKHRYYTPGGALRVSRKKYPYTE